MEILRCWFSTLFAINLLFTTKQYKVDNIDNFMYYGKTRFEFSELNSVESTKSIEFVEDYF